MRLRVLMLSILVTILLAGCAPTGTSDGAGDGLHSIVPAVTGMTLTEASNELEAAGYVLGTISGDTGTPGVVVVRQEPIASTSYPNGAGVDLELGLP